MTYEFDEAEVRKAVSILHPDGKLFEVRFIDGRWNASGYFSGADKLIEAMRKTAINPGANAYITLNQINDACYSRKQRDRILPNASPTTSDIDITGLDWLMVDLDPKRPAGTSSSDEQMEEAHGVAERIYSSLHDRGWADPVVSESGNGFHLLYRLNLKNTKERVELVTNVLKALNAFFSTDGVDIDLKTFNPARICKLYGTVARKGVSTAERPHRASRMLYVPDVIEPVDISYLEELTALLPAPEAPQRYNGYNPSEFDLQGWIDEHGLAVTEKTTWSGGTKWVLEQCPFNPEHRHKDACILQTNDGKICFNCFHNSCSGHHWKELRELYEPDAYTKKSERRDIPNYLDRRKEAADRMPANRENAFLSPEEIRAIPAPEGVYVKTGIEGIDGRMMGLKKGYVSVLSGLRSAGKSSVLSQIVVNARQNGYRVALFSGEMGKKHVLKWLVQQAAGKNCMRPTKYDRVFYPMDGIEERVSKWLDGFVWIYNNDYGSRFDAMLVDFEALAAAKKLDLILIDNLMALEIDVLDRDQYQAQKKFVLALQAMAKRMNIHVMFVAHPRKSQGYLRLEDVAGTGDLTNAVDNAFIVHRVNNDYKARTREAYGWKDDNELYRADNVIEICKDRDLGWQDIHIPLWFEVETKRLKNSMTEYVHYGWEDGNRVPATAEERGTVPEGMTRVDDEEIPW